MKKVAIENEDYMTAKMLALEGTTLADEIKKGINTGNGKIDVEI
jgi:hypothetical protein